MCGDKWKINILHTYLIISMKYVIYNRKKKKNYRLGCFADVARIYHAAFHLGRLAEQMPVVEVFIFFLPATGKL